MSDNTPQGKVLAGLDAAGFLVPAGANDWMTPSQAAERAKRAGASGARLRMVGAMSAEDMARWRALRNGTHFLVRNNANATGERYRCGRVYGGVKCNERHDFFTCMCIPLPFKGLEEALYAYTTTSYDERLTKKLLQWAPELGAMHPQMARSLRSVHPGDQDIIAVALGVAEPITETYARQLADTINLRRPPKRVVI